MKKFVNGTSAKVVNFKEIESYDENFKEVNLKINIKRLKVILIGILLFISCVVSVVTLDGDITVLLFWMPISICFMFFSGKFEKYFDDY